MNGPVEPTPDAFRNPFMRYFAATRPAFISASLMAGLIGLALASFGGAKIDGALAAVTILFALLTHAGVNVLNDYYDALNGTDDMNTERIFPFTGGSRFIQNGVLTPLQTRNFGFALLACVVVAGLWLVTRSTSELLYVGCAGLFIGWAYSAPPFSLNSRGFGEVCVASGILLITIGADLVQRNTLDVAPLIAGMPYALLATNLLYINQFPDRSADIAAGKLHWVARMQTANARWIYVLLVALANLWTLLAVLFGWLPLAALLALFALPLSVQASRLLVRHAGQPQRLEGAIKLTIAALLLHGLLMSLGLSVS
jgi:1,4-dihydroxy-2-naphthoate octaprenyltransferase